MQTRIKEGIIARVSERGLPGQGKIISFYFRPGKRKEASKTRLFIPIPYSDRRALKRYSRRINRPEKIDYGDATIWRYNDGKIEWTNFCPFTSIQPPKSEYRITRRGISSRIHHGLVEYVAEHYKSATIQHDSLLSDDRKLQLKAMDIDHTKEYPIEEYRDIVRAYMTRRFGMKFDA
ncbi:MAG: hypothetical protein V1644_00460 [Candidatus Micrarchaeota archaeon]